MLAFALSSMVCAGAAALVRARPAPYSPDIGVGFPSIPMLTAPGRARALVRVIMAVGLLDGGNSPRSIAFSADRSRTSWSLSDPLRSSWLLSGAGYGKGIHRFISFSSRQLRVSHSIDGGDCCFDPFGLSASPCVQPIMHMHGGVQCAICSICILAFSPQQLRVSHSIDGGDCCFDPFGRFASSLVDSVLPHSLMRGGRGTWGRQDFREILFEIIIS